MASSYGEYEAVIGLEVHAQLLTRTKCFCACATSFGDPPNTHTCPVCLGLPGALPVLSAEAVRLAARAALALGCATQHTSVFARKNYFYPDLPKGYQISQYEMPLAVNGALDIEVDGMARRAAIRRVHMEEDAGKNLHGHGGESVVDLNRAGTPLIEIVGEPDLRSPAEAAEYLRRLREVLMFMGVNDGNLEQGSFRCDANVSVRKQGESTLGTRTELKNINSFRFVEAAIEVEIRRQIALVERGERVRQQTRGYNADKRETYLLRDKENEAGYRYFPEPDLPPLVLDDAFVASVRAALPSTPAARRRRWVDRLHLSPYAASVLSAHPQIAAFFEATADLVPDAQKAANFIQSEVLRDVRTEGLAAEIPVSPTQVAELLALVDAGAISGKQAKEVYARMRGTSELPGAIVESRGMSVMSDEGPLEDLARKIAADNPKQAAGYRAGKANLLGYFVGMMMKQTGGSADPAVVNRVLQRVLAGPEAERARAPGIAAAKGAAPAGVDRNAETKGRPNEPRGPVIAGASLVPHPPRPVEPGPAARPASTPEPGARPAPAGPPSARSPLAQSVAPVASGASPPLEPTTLTSASGVPAVALPVVPSRPVSFEAFARVELRVGVIVSAAPVPRKDKLLDLSVDVGDESGPRRVVAGLARSFPPEGLVGRRVVVACNLEPRDFGKGLVSQGMILAAGASDALALCTVDRDVPAGTRVK